MAKKKLAEEFNYLCDICHRPMRKEVHTHKVGGGTVKVHKPKNV